MRVAKQQYRSLPLLSSLAAVCNSTLAMSSLMDTRDVHTRTELTDGHHVMCSLLTHVATSNVASRECCPPPDTAQDLCLSSCRPHYFAFSPVYRRQPQLQAPPTCPRYRHPAFGYDCSHHVGSRTDRPVTDWLSCLVWDVAAVAVASLIRVEASTSDDRRPRLQVCDQHTHQS